MSSYVAALEPTLDQVGFLTLNENGAIIASGGELENDETKAEIIYRLLSMHHKIDKFLDEGEGCTTLSVIFKDHTYEVCLSNKKIHVLKKKLSLVEEESSSYILDTNIPINNSINA